jgi:hypothetical protein
MAVAVECMAHYSGRRVVGYNNGIHYRARQKEKHDAIV